MMYSTESVSTSSHPTSKAPSTRKISLKTIDKRLNHLREELKHLQRRKTTYSTSNLLSEPQVDDHDDHHMQYQKRLNQLLRLHDKQVNNLQIWHYYRCHAIEQMYGHELRQSDETFRTKKLDFKSKLILMLNDKRRYLDLEHQHVNIRCRQFSNNEQYLLNKPNNSTDVNLFDGYNHSTNESAQQQPQRPTYNLRRAAANDVISDNSSTTTISSLNDLSIFSRSNSCLLPPFGGIELQRSLSSGDIDQDIMSIQKDFCSTQSIMPRNPSRDLVDDGSTKSSIDVRIEEGRLWYQRAWFSRNSPILLVFDDLEIVPALVLTVGRNDVLIRRSGTNIKHRVSLSLLHDGHLAIRKRHCGF